MKFFFSIFMFSGKNVSDANISLENINIYLFAKNSISAPSGAKITLFTLH